MSVRVWTCSGCGATAPADPTRRGCGLPHGWEHVNPLACRECVSVGNRPPAEGARPVCRDCVAQLLADCLAALAEHVRR